MRRSKISFGMWAIVFVAVGLAGPVAWGSLYHLTPNPSDLSDLDHTKYYKWGINTPWSFLEDEVTATLTLKGIRNWDSGANVLFIHLLNYAPLGVTSGNDYEGGGDYFAGNGVLLVQYNNLPTYPQDLVYTFTSAQLNSLLSYASDGRFALGFDPDCHFYNDGISLDISDKPNTPEPATVGLLLAGAFGLARKRVRV